MVYKLLSVNPDKYEDAPREGIRRILKYFSGEMNNEYDLDVLIGKSDIDISKEI